MDLDLFLTDELAESLVTKTQHGMLRFCDHLILDNVELKRWTIDRGVQSFIMMQFQSIHSSRAGSRIADGRDARSLARPPSPGPEQKLLIRQSARYLGTSVPWFWIEQTGRVSSSSEPAKRAHRETGSGNGTGAAATGLGAAAGRGLACRELWPTETRARRRSW